MTDKRVKTTQTYQTSDGLYHETMDAANNQADRLDWNQWWDAHYMKSEGHNITPGITFNFLKEYYARLPWKLFGVKPDPALDFGPTDVPTPGPIVHVPDDPSTRETELSNRVKHLEEVLRQIMPGINKRLWQKCQDALYARDDKQ